MGDSSISLLSSGLDGLLHLRLLEHILLRLDLGHFVVRYLLIPELLDNL